MFRETKDVQMSLDDRLLFADDQVKTAVDSSRAKLVGDIIYPNINEDNFRGLFSDKNSRPNISIRRYVSALILKRMYRLSDETLLEFLRCGAMNFQYALHTTQDKKQPFSENSLRRFRRRVEKYNKENKCDLIRDEYLRISRKLAMDMGILHLDPDKGETEETKTMVRIDSMEVESHAKAMSRLEILYTSNVIVIRYLLKAGLNDVVPEGLSHYFEDGDKNRIMYHQAKKEKDTQSQESRVDTAVKEMLLLKSAMEENFTQAFPSKIPEYMVFLRVLEEQPDDGSGQVFIADGAYNSDRLEELAAQKNIDLQTTSLTGAQPYDIDADFTLNDAGNEILSCPCGYVPTENKYNEKTGLITATMPENCCKDCPHKNDCNVYSNKKKTVSKVKLTKKMVKRAQQARYFTTEEGKANARIRNGVEGIMSVMRRKYDIDHLPVFGIDQVSNWIWTTLMSYNLVKYQKYERNQKRRLPA